MNESFEDYEPVAYVDIKHNYQPRHAKKVRFRDDSLAVGALAVAIIVVFLFAVAVIAL